MAGDLRAPQVPSPAGRRRGAAWTLAVAGPVALTVAVLATAPASLPTTLMLLLALTVGVALLGGLRPALLAAVLSSLAANFFFTPPVRTWTIADHLNALELAALLAVALGVSAVVDLAARRSAEAARARAEADVLLAVAGSVVRGTDAVAAMLEELRTGLGLAGVALLRPFGAGWQTLGSAGEPVSPHEADAVVPVPDGLALATRGRALTTADLRVQLSVGVQAGGVLERARLQAEADAVQAERARSATRTALLAAVSHDLRTPLAAIKAAVTGLLTAGGRIPPDDARALLGDVDTETDRLQGLIDNLLDMSRLDTGVVTPVLRPVAPDEVVPRVVDGLPAARLRVEVPETLPLVLADAGLLERAVANVVGNAVRFSPPDAVVLLAGRPGDGVVELAVTDHGPGVPPAQREDMFRPFQRLGDSPQGHGVGLGLAVARGLVEAGGGTLEPRDTPGGGLTMVLTLPVAEVAG